jgi:hypothetical protein
MEKKKSKKKRVKVIIIDKEFVFRKGKHAILEKTCKG